MGSWKIIWIFCTTSASSSCAILPLIFLPLNRISPALAGAIRTMARPIVVLPEPDSPTRPKVSPLRMKKLTFFTAVNRPPLTRKSTVRFFTSRSMSFGSLIPRSRNA